MHRNGATPRYGLLGFPFSRFPSEDSSYSSLDNVVWSTARALSRRGTRVTVGAWDVSKGDADGVEVVPVDGRPDYALRTAIEAGSAKAWTPRWSSRLHHPFYLLGGIHALKRRGVDVIQVTHEFSNLLPARLLAGRVPLITQIHAVWVDDQPEFARRLLQADAISTVSDFVRRSVIEVEPRLEPRTATVRNGVDLEVFPGRAAWLARDPDGPAAWRARLGVDGRPLVVAVGRVTPEKGTHVLADAAAILRARGHDFVVAVAGQRRARYQRPGRARTPLWREIERLNDHYFERVTSIVDGQPFHLLDTVKPPELRRLLAAADLFVAPSLSPEPCPLPVLEALAMDLPVVASADGGYPELVGDAGLLVPPGDPGALADAMEPLLGSAERRRALARGARAQAARHSWDATAEALIGLVERLA